ncbi:MAG: hypothetical protein ACXVZV_04800 [Terriglobales bacterium]
MTLVGDAWIALMLYWLVSALKLKRMKYIAPLHVRVIQLVLGAFLGVILITVGLAYKGKQEELRLAQTFGDSFVAHQQCTGMFLPRIR